MICVFQCTFPPPLYKTVLHGIGVTQKVVCTDFRYLFFDYLAIFPIYYVELKNVTPTHCHFLMTLRNDIHFRVVDLVKLIYILSVHHVPLMLW